MERKIKIYLAGSMFCEADRMYNAYLAQKIRERVGDLIDLYVPQENMAINDKTKCANSEDIFWGDYNRLKECDIFIARIDGDIPPSGTSAEVGMMSQRIQTWDDKKGPRPTIIGLCTDSRNPKTTYLDAKNELMRTRDYESQYCYFNLFTLGCIKVNGKLVTSADALVDAVEEKVKEFLGKKVETVQLMYVHEDYANLCVIEKYKITYADGSVEYKEEVTCRD